MINSVGTAIDDIPVAIKFWTKEFNVPLILVLSLPDLKQDLMNGI